MSNQIPALSYATTLSGDGVSVIGLTETDGQPVLLGATEALGDAAQLLQAAQDLGAKADAEHVVVLPATEGSRVVVVGLGKDDVSPAVVRRSVGAAVRRVRGMQHLGAQQVNISLDAADPELIQAAGEGAILGAYQPSKVTEKDPEEPVVAAVTVVGQLEQAEGEAAAQRAAVIARSVAQARDWVNQPPNQLYPETFAAAAQEALQGLDVAVEVLDEAALKEGGYGGILAVGGGSSRLPRLVRIDYTPAEAKFHLALVGKGITFDSGGLDIKPGESMATMKTDMAGAAAVISATEAIAELGLPVRVTTYAAMAENLPSGTAYRRSDVLRMFDGQTVENGNTDAEGRLVMADALARANQDDPELVVDVATLTGACMVAVGLRTGGVMTSDDATAERILNAAESAGEAFWHLPIPDEAPEELKSDVADFKSTGTTRWGGALTAAAFLAKFVDDGRSWAHLDIAGPSHNPGQEYGHVAKGGTGVAVSTLVSLAQQAAAK